MEFTGGKRERGGRPLPDMEEELDGERRKQGRESIVLHIIPDCIGTCLEGCVYYELQNHSMDMVMVLGNLVIILTSREHMNASTQGMNFTCR